MTPASRILGSGVDAAFARAAAARDRFEPSFALEEMGRVVSVGPGIAEIAGLPGIGSEELLRCRGGLLAIAFDLAPQRIGAVLLGESAQLRAGDAVQRTGRVVDVPVGESLLGRVVDPLGRPAEAKGPLRETARMPIERPAPAIMNRAPVTVPLHTGIKVIDALVPVGRGQRELILGDRQTGKTSIAVDTIINQRDQDVLCVYCAIGQRTSTVAKVVADLRAQGAMDHTVVVFAEGNDAPGLSYIAPYAATSIAEHFMERGRDVLIVYDDLTNHARAYRELSLLMRRPPGREAYPGDIFYLHSRLLERATHLAPEHGGGSLTALPIVETQAQDLSAYMPTNLISITDGQIYVSPTLFGLGILPAVDVGRSVSRVGGKAQLPGHRAATAGLKLAYAQFEELETFTRFGARLDERTRGIIEHGRRIREFLKQGEHENLRLQDQIVLLLALGAGVFDEIPLERMRDAQQRVRGVAAVLGEALLQRVTAAARPSDSDRDSVLHAARAALLELRVSP